MQQEMASNPKGKAAQAKLWSKIDGPAGSII
jgi:hypothetical protein